MIMEAFEKGGERFDYEISGHSGDSPNIVFIKASPALLGNGLCRGLGLKG